MVVFKKIVVGLLLIYVVVCMIAYFVQERLIFFPEKLPADYPFVFEQQVEELRLQTGDGTSLSGLHFKLENPKGVIFYLHGNAGDIGAWGHTAAYYLDLGYAVVMFDYRGYGKSEGAIYSQAQFYADTDLMYRYVKQHYDESQITIVGFSIGTAAATRLAAQNKPKRLVLQAPYYSLRKLVSSIHPYLPSFLLKYAFMTIDFLKQVEVPITVFHGESDSLIPIENAHQLKAAVPALKLITIPHCEHNDIPSTSIFKKEMRAILLEK